MCRTFQPYNCMQTHQNFLQGEGKIMFQMNLFFSFKLLISFGLLQLFCPLVILRDEWSKRKLNFTGRME
jgi:hypothetical protein